MRSLTLTVATLLAFGCAEQAPPAGYGTLQLAMDVPACTPGGAALSGQGVCSFKVSVLKGAWTAVGSRPESIFDAGCVQYGGDVITVGPIESVGNATIYMEFFSDASCETAAMYGLRGGVEIPEGDAPAGNWFVPTFPLDKFGRFPVLDGSKYQQAAALTCGTDDDCTAQNDDGTYVLSPLGRCGTGGFCELPRSLYPLNTDGPRAFHTATALDDGRVLLVGGLGREAGGQYFATDETFETFDPVTMTFGKIENVDGISGQRIAMHSMVNLGGNKLVVVGGAENVRLAFADASAVGAGKRTLGFNFPDEANNLSSLVYSVDLGTRRAETGALPSPVVAAHAALVGESEVLVSGGVVPVNTGTGLVPTNRADLCTLSGAPSCASVAAMNTDRSGHCGICKDGDRVCNELLLFGGSHSTDPDVVKANLAEIYSPAEQTFTSKERLISSLNGNVTGPVCVRSGGTNYLVGGAERRNLPPSIAPMVLAEQGSGIGGAELKGLDKLDTAFRVYTTATPLADGSVLVTGGLSDTGRALASAYVIRGDSVVSAVNMNEARFGHTATVITSGPLAGAILIAGGFTTDGAGNLAFASGAEIYTPSAR